MLYGLLGELRFEPTAFAAAKGVGLLLPHLEMHLRNTENLHQGGHRLGLASLLMRVSCLLSDPEHNIKVILPVQKDRGQNKTSSKVQTHAAPGRHHKVLASSDRESESSDIQEKDGRCIR